MYEMCRSTPVTLPTGHHFETSKCEDRRVSCASTAGKLCDLTIHIELGAKQLARLDRKVGCT